MGKAIVIPGVDFSQGNLGQVTFLEPLQALSIVGSDEVIVTGAYSVAYTPVNAYERDVVWSIVSGSEYATIDQNGRVTAQEGASADSVTIRVTSVAHPSIYAEKTIAVSLPESLLNIHKTFDGTGADVVETDYALFSDDMPNWTMFVYAPDAATAPNAMRCALACMDESGSPYYGVAFNMTHNKTAVLCDININENSEENYRLEKKTGQFVKTAARNNVNMGLTGEQIPVGISRRGDDMFYTTDGTTWIPLGTISINMPQTLVVGSYRDADGNLGRYYNSGDQYLDVVLYPTALVGGSTFFAEHGVKSAIYTLTDYSCDGTAATAIDTGLTPFDGESYPNGLIMQVDLTLPTGSVSNEQTLFGCKSYGEATSNGLKLVNNVSGTMTFNISPAIANAAVGVTRGNRYQFSVRLKDGDYAVAFNNKAAYGASSFAGHNWPLTIGGALSALPDTWYDERFVAFTIHSLTIREL